MAEARFTSGKSQTLRSRIFSKLKRAPAQSAGMRTAASSSPGPRVVMNAPGSLIRRTLEHNKDALAVLYPEKGTKPSVYYLGLDAFFVSAANAAAPMAGRDLRAGGSHV